MKETISQYIEIKFIQFQRPFNKDKYRDNIFIKGDYYAENNWDISKHQLYKDKEKLIAFITIDIRDGRDFKKNPKIEFKFISENRSNHGDIFYKFQWEKGFNRFILLDKIKETIIDRYKNDAMNTFKDFKVKYEDNKSFEDTFSYDFSTKTLIIKCVDREYETNYADKI